MLMANSVEGRFPFLDRDVVELTNSFPASYKLLSLDEKHVLKRVARKYIPSAIVDRVKQPYRAPDALSFIGADAPSWIDDAVSETSLSRAGLFDPRAVSALWKKCKTRKDDGQFSNADNMAVVGVLSAQLLHRQFVEELPAPRIPEMKTRVVVG
jgi:asparagine synthase (glutamine-hydrolysing)